MPADNGERAALKVSLTVTPVDLSAAIHLVGDTLGKVIAELESPAAFELEERIRMYTKARRAGDAESDQRLADEVAMLNLRGWRRTQWRL